MKKFLIISPKNRTIYNFRGDLIKEIQKNGYEVFVTLPNGDNLDKIKELNLKYEIIPLTKHGLNFFEDIKYLFKLSSFIKEIKPDKILAYTVKPIIYGSIANKISNGNNFYSMMTGSGYVFISKSFKAKMLNFIVKNLYRIAFSFSKKIIFFNIDDLNDFVNQKIVSKEKSFVVNGSGVNLDKFYPLPYPEKVTFFMLSRLLKSKGVMQYLKACEKIKKKYPNVRCILLGKIEDMPDAIPEEEIMSYVNSNIVELFGETDNVLEYYKQCSVYVLTSYREGIPRTVLEAMACARPIIVTDVPGCRETVIENYNGFLVKLNDVDELVEKMEWFIKNKNYIEIFGRNSYNLCKEKFDVKKVNEKLIEILGI